MISDNERREVARRMREFDVSEFKESAIVPFLECLGIGYVNWRGVLDILADLIDRPTCSIKRGYQTTWGVCSRCGALVNAERAVRTATEYMPTRYCPNCGVEVAE